VIWNKYVVIHVLTLLAPEREVTGAAMEVSLRKDVNCLNVGVDSDYAGAFGVTELVVPGGQAGSEN